MRLTATKIQVTYHCPKLDREMTGNVLMDQTWYHVTDERCILEVDCECGKSHAIEIE